MRLGSSSFFSFTSRGSYIIFFKSQASLNLFLVIIMAMPVISRLLVSLFKLAAGPHPGASNSAIRDGVTLNGI